MAITLNSVLQRKSLRLEKVKDLAHGCTDSKWLSQNANPVGTVHTGVLAEPKNLANPVPEVLERHHASASPGGFIKTDCWVPPLQILIQEVWG